MLLKREDIAAARIGWGDKSTGLREIAEELNVGLDSLVFFDDDPAVRMEVSARAPEVTVVPLPSAPERYVETLSRLWLFDATTTTREDRARTRMIKEERERQQVQQSAPGLEQYLAQLQLQVVFRLAREEDFQRVAQLTQKTHQFNLSLRRRSVEEIRTLATEGDVYIVSARDRFGEYGTIGVAIVTAVPDRQSTVELDTLLLSCRALGRGIEQAFLSSVCHEARAKGAQRIEGDLLHGPRNQPVRRFVEQYGFVSLGEGRLGLELEEVPPLPSHIQWESEMPVLRSRP
jgi:iturin family lipopeptide synthetase A